MANSNELDIPDSIFLETVDNFCYSVDMSDTDAVCSDVKLNRTEISTMGGFKQKEKCRTLRIIGTETIQFCD